MSSSCFVVFRSLAATQTAGRHNSLDLATHAKPAVAEGSSDGVGGEEEDDRVQGGVQGGEEESLYSPGRTLLINEAHNVGYVVWCKSNGEIEQRGHRQAHRPFLFVGRDVGHGAQDADHVDIAEQGDGKRQAEEEEAELQPEREKDAELLWGEAVVTRGDVKV